MTIKPIKTKILLPKSSTIEDLIDEYVPKITENSILVITSKVVSLCEGAVIPKSDTTKAELIEEQAEYTLKNSRYNITFTITNDMIIPTAGIDESNSDGVYVLWPKNPQESANNIRAYLKKRFSLQNVGVIITDSTHTPMRRGVSGVYIAHSGFQALNDYRGESDLFGRPQSLGVSNIALGLAAAAVVTMGEGTEQTPLATIKNVPFVKFQQRDPSETEVNELSPSLKDDLFAPFFVNAAWEKTNPNFSQYKKATEDTVA